MTRKKEKQNGKGKRRGRTQVRTTAKPLSKDTGAYSPLHSPLQCHVVLSNQRKLLFREVSKPRRECFFSCTRQQFLFFGIRKGTVRSD